MRRDKQLFFAVRDFVIRRLTKKAYRAIKINYAQQMLQKHLIERRALMEQKKVFRQWQKKLLLRIRIRMCLIKYVEYRGAKMLGLQAFKDAKTMTDKMLKVKAISDNQIAARSF